MFDPSKIVCSGWWESGISVKAHMSGFSEHSPIHSYRLIRASIVIGYFSATVEYLGINDYSLDIKLTDIPVLINAKECNLQLAPHSRVITIFSTRGSDYKKLIETAENTIQAFLVSHQACILNAERPQSE